LLDSISKNVGSPYTLLFGTNLFQTYTQAYLLVDDPTRTKFINLFKTWKLTKSSSGLPIFPQEPIDKIERFLIKASTVYQQQLQQQHQHQHQRQHQQKASSNSPQIPNAQLQFQQTFPQQLFQSIDKLSYLTNQRLIANPQDTQIRSKLDVINQLKAALQSQSLPPQALQAVASQIEDMTRQEEAILRNSSTPQPQPQPQQPKPQSSSVVPNLSNLLSSNSNFNESNQGTITSQKNPLGLLNTIANLKSPQPSQQQQQQQQQQPSSNSAAKPDLSSLISTLHKTGLAKSKPAIPSSSLLKSLLSKQPSSSSTTPTPTDATLSSTNSSKIQNEFTKYDINSKNFLTLDPSETFKVIFIRNYPNKCGQCGKRFDTSEKGLNLRRDHLDWHFRMNKKLKDGLVAQSKIWYLDDEQFVNFRDFEVFNKDYDNENNTFSNDDSRKKNEAEANKNEKKYVVVPSDSSDMSCVCGICKETLRGQYDDELGEWIWPNAIESKGKVFHASCFNETNKPASLSNLISSKRNREDTGGGEQAGNGGGKKKALNINGIDMNLLKNIVSNVKTPAVKKEEKTSF
jgi:pre-mRNA cleavage complex 2 protein Pcf11